MAKLTVLYIFSLMFLGQWLMACGSLAPTPEPDRVATRVAEDEAVIATLTAKASTPEPSISTFTPVPEPSTPVPTQVAQTSSNTPPTPIPTTLTLTPPGCTIVSNADLRNGPGLVFEPPLGVISAGADVTPMAYSSTGFPAGQWVQIQISNQTGWVNADAQYIKCNILLNTLPPGVVPPTPTPLPLPTNTPPPPPTQTPVVVVVQPTPLPTRPLYDVLEVDGDDGNQALRGSQNINGGRYLIFPGFGPGSLDEGNPTFRDKLAFQAEVFDTANGGLRDGDGIKHVKFTIKQHGEVVYEHQENNAGYCVFGGGEPNCNVLVFELNNYRWPEPYNHFLIEEDEYDLTVVITPHRGEDATWNWNFEIDGIPVQGSASPARLEAQIKQTGPGTTSDVIGDQLVFQVEAYDAAEGNRDGDGISHVELRILDQNRNVVYSRREDNAGYCAFSGGEPHCDIFTFEIGDRWPDNGPEIRSGTYYLQATVFGNHGDRMDVRETTIRIQ